MNQLDIDLSQFCNANDSREFIRKPWSDDQYSYATDGHIIIRVNRMPEFSGPGASANPSWKHLPWDHDTLTDWHPLPSEIPGGLRVECKSCEGTGKVITCEDCDGDGEVEYEFFSKSGKTYNIEHECPICEGRGKKKGDTDRCEDCEGQGYRIVAVPVKIGLIGLSISNQLLQRVKDLPGIMIAVTGRIDDMPPVRFRFDGGCGLIMPMRDQGTYA